MTRRNGMTGTQRGNCRKIQRMLLEAAAAEVVAVVVAVVEVAKVVEGAAEAEATEVG